MEGQELSLAMIGCGTSAIITRHVNFWRPSVRIIRRVPNVLIGVSIVSLLKVRLVGRDNA